MSETTSPVVVGVNGTYRASHTAQWAAAVADRFDASLRIVHADPPRS